MENKIHPDHTLYAIKGRYTPLFQSIDHAGRDIKILKLRKVIKDAGVLALLDRIIRPQTAICPDGVGIPVGNLPVSYLQISILTH